MRNQKKKLVNSNQSTYMLYLTVSFNIVYNNLILWGHRRMKPWKVTITAYPTKLKTSETMECRNNIYIDVE